MTPFIERRLGHRYEASAPRNQIGWRVHPGRVRRLRRKSEVALLVNVSVSGAAVLAAYRRDLRVGSHVTISFEGTTGDVVISRISSCGELQNLYGIEFAEPCSPLTALVYDRFLTGHPVSQGTPAPQS